MAKVVKSHALSAIGLTAFKKTSEVEKPSVYRVDNFNLLLSLQVGWFDAIGMFSCEVRYADICMCPVRQAILLVRRV